MKVLSGVDETDSLKEARFLHFLKHTNLVDFKAMCLSENALMLEYVEFNFNLFGKPKTVSSLDGLLKELDLPILSILYHQLLVKS